MSEFYVAATGAAAALAGLVIVAMSVNVDKVVKFPALVSRAAASIAILIAATVSCLAALVEQAGLWTGLEIIVAGAIALILALVSVRSMLLHRGGATLASALLRTLIAAIPALIFVIAGVLVLFGIDAGPLLAIGTMLAIAVAVVNTWVLLVEIRR